MPRSITEEVSCGYLDPWSVEYDATTTGAGNVRLPGRIPGGVVRTPPGGLEEPNAGISRAVIGL